MTIQIKFIEQYCTLVLFILIQTSGRCYNVSFKNDTFSEVQHVSFTSVITIASILYLSYLNSLIRLSFLFYQKFSFPLDICHISVVPDLPGKCREDNEHKACWEHSETQAHNL